MAKPSFSFSMHNYTSLLGKILGDRRRRIEAVATIFKLAPKITTKNR